MALALPGHTTATVGVPWTPAGMGEHTLTAIADSDDEVNESDEANNDMAYPVIVALYDQFYADSGGAPDPAYDPITGYGWLSGTQTDTWGSTPEESYRWNPAGPVRYRFDYLAPDADYHVDATPLSVSPALLTTAVTVTGRPLRG